ncbi:Protocadherin beta-18 [Frankliniella fusca]|uniref:Protocadherin beta-18 n=1 Tax=Frankliniella fusca TaxID=407009 RepID=A0AAE1H9M2_9NEOP|nr:Protocadherin beta-18 [Frankliniella fusca]
MTQWTSNLVDVYLSPSTLPPNRGGDTHNVLKNKAPVLPCERHGKSAPYISSILNLKLNVGKSDVVEQEDSGANRKVKYKFVRAEPGGQSVPPIITREFKARHTLRHSLTESYEANEQSSDWRRPTSIAGGHQAPNSFH